ncbi:MAG: glycosyltransferase [Jatrophihabitans sp.]|nr:glycosyltransferase [Jatrophihabitans sp.]
MLYVDHIARMSGGEIALLRTLVRMRDRVAALVVLGEDGPFAEALGTAGIAVRVLPLDPAVRDVRRDRVLRLGALRGVVSTVHYILALRRLIRAERPDLVHTNTLKAALYGGAAARLARVPVVWHIRDRIADDYLPPTTVRLIRLAARVLPAAIITNSEATMSTLPSVRCPTLVVRDAALPPVAPEPTPRSSHLTIGMAGRLTEWKGQDYFLRAFALAFHGTTVNASIIGSALFGEDHYAAGLVRLAAELDITDQVEFRGFRADMWSEYSRLDMLVHFSLTPEPYGQVVVEGMSAGLCVLAAAEGGPAELIEDEVTGVLVPPRNVEALSTAMLRWARDAAGRARIAEAARGVTAALDPELTTAPIVELYRTVARAHGPALTGPR